ncbi:MAG: ribonuclease HII [Pseudomonadota bacterium]
MSGVDKPDFAHEAALLKAGYQVIAGCDEVGRGPLAGPVVAAAVILDPFNIPDGLNDSKKLTQAKRENLYGEILSRAIVSIVQIPAKTIDRINIGKASLKAMRDAILNLSIVPDVGLFDGRQVPAGLDCRCEALVKGDQRSVSIAAASIIAKVTRDRMMEEAGRHHPAYGFEAHKGYGTAVHRSAIEEHGPTLLHRMSFKPLNQHV